MYTYNVGRMDGLIIQVKASDITGVTEKLNEMKIFDVAFIVKEGHYTETIMFFTQKMKGHSINAVA
jgi:hypothetical protein